MDPVKKFVYLTEYRELPKMIVKYQKLKGEFFGKKHDRVWNGRI